MNLECIGICNEIMGKLLMRPISKIFWDVDSSSIHQAHSLSFSIISEKLRCGLYKSFDQWKDDVKTLLSYYQSKSESKTLRHWAILQLLKDFNKYIKKYTLTFEKPSIAKLSKMLARVESYIDNCYYFKLSNEGYEGKPSAMILQKNYQSIEDLYYTMEIINSPTIILRLVSYAYELQPELIDVNDESLSIKFYLMKPETFNLFVTYLKQLLNECASGKMQPYVHSFNDALNKD